MRRRKSTELPEESEGEKEANREVELRQEDTTVAD